MNINLNNTDKILARLEILKWIQSNPQIGDAGQPLFDICMAQIQDLLLKDLGTIEVTNMNNKKHWDFPG